MRKSGRRPGLLMMTRKCVFFEEKRVIYNLGSISGGKDSTALWLLARERETPNFIPAFADGSHENPITYEYLDYLESRLGPIRRVKADLAPMFANRRKFLEGMLEEPDKVVESKGWSKDRIHEVLQHLQPTGVPFLDLCMIKGRFPSTRARFCSQELKHIPILEQVVKPLLEDPNAEVVSWQGVRAEESPYRAKLPECEDGEIDGVTTYRPILQWTVEQVFEMHRRHNIKPNPLYMQGMGRVGCSPCIHSRKDELMELANRFPAEVERVAAWERAVAKVSKMGISSFFAYDKVPGNNTGEVHDLERVGIHAVIAWSRTGKGGVTFDWLRAQGEGKTCSSLYGLCE